MTNVNSRITNEPNIWLDRMQMEPLMSALAKTGSWELRNEGLMHR